MFNEVSALIDAKMWNRGAVRRLQLFGNDVLAALGILVCTVFFHWIAVEQPAVIFSEVLVWVTHPVATFFLIRATCYLFSLARRLGAVVYETLGELF